MKIRHVLALVAALAALSAYGKTKLPPAPPVASAKPVPLTATAEGRALYAAWEKAQYRFTPEVKAAYLSWVKAQALEVIAKAGQKLPADFLSWVDSDPSVAATVYGIAPNGAQRLVLLRSLDLDLGAEEVRKKHLQLALAITDRYASLVDAETLSNPGQGISLKERDLFTLKIPECPLVRVDTHPKDRPLDLNDHIINFLEATNVAAWQVMSNPDLQKEFNQYMKEHGQSVAIDYGNSISPWSPKRAEIMRAYRLFRKAYEDKGLLPKQNDPAPTPTEMAAYLIRNDNYRFPEGVKRGWPRFPLNAPWPVLDYLVGTRMPLREREFIWKRFRDHNIATGYGAYVGQIAQYPDFLKARRLSALDFSYDTYPMRLKDGGVCGTMSNIGRGLNIALGVPACQGSQPSHSCFIAVGGNDSRGYGLSVGQSVAGIGSTHVSGRGIFINELIKYYPVNYGLLPFLDSRCMLQFHSLLPPETPVEHRLTLLYSGFNANPYNLAIVNAIQTALTTPRQQIEFWQTFEKTLAGVNKPGCPQRGYYNNIVHGTLNSRLAPMPIPEDRQKLADVAGFLAGDSDPLWLKYQLATIGMSKLKTKLSEDLQASVTGTRTPESCNLLQARLTTVAHNLRDPKEKKAWGEQLLPIIAGHETYLLPASGKKKARQVQDPCAVLVYQLTGQKTPAQLVAEEAKRKAAEAKTQADKVRQDLSKQQGAAVPEK